MFSPKYTITNSILKNISSSESARELIESSYLIPAWESKLRSEARESSIIYSAFLEGNKLSDEEIKDILNGDLGEIIDIDTQEILNLTQTFDYLSEVSSTQFLTVEIILNLHKLLTQRISDKTGFRSSQIILKESRSGKVSYSPPPAVEVPYLLEDLLNWINEDRETHPIIKASLAHFEIFRIHPFVVGSNSLARLLSRWVLMVNGFKVRDFLSFEEYLKLTEESYYSTLHSVANQQVLDTHDRDLTPWLDYFSGAISTQLQQLRASVKEISENTRVSDKLGGELILNERQIAIIEYLRKYKFMRNKDFRKIFPDYSDDTVLRELMKLRKMGLVEREGRTKKATYQLTKESPPDSVPA